MMRGFLLDPLVATIFRRLYLWGLHLDTSWRRVVLGRHLTYQKLDFNQTSKVMERT